LHNDIEFLSLKIAFYFKPGFLFSATRNPGFKILPRIVNTTSTTAWEKGFNKVSHACYSKVLNAPTYYTTLAPNGALPDPKFCNQCKPWKLSLKLASKNSWIPEKDVLPQTHLIRYAPKTQDTW